ncbi:MAG: hypothetical protein J5691_00190 [Bacilli bacterium]|nr:hypothetical protein [Bacilli bacterium]
MHRSKGSFKARAIHKYQENLKQIKKRKVSSIWDIIDDPSLHFFQKVDYIRHHFVYYDGNYELFHDENGKPTHTKKLLDKVIAGIINKKIDPSELNDLNKEILKDHKNRLEQNKIREELELNSYLQEQRELEKPVIRPIIEETPDLDAYKQGITNADIYFKLIDEYLGNLPEKERTKAATWKYKELKKVAKWWAMNNRPSLLKAEKVPHRTPQQETNELLAGYRKYAAQKWKNTSEED